MGLSYSKTVGGGFYHNIKVHPTDLESDFLKYCLNILDTYYHDEPIRKVSICAGNLTNNDSVQLNMFESIEDIEQEEKLNSAVDEIKERFGKNAIYKASALLDDSTIIERNAKIGGHHE